MFAQPKLQDSESIPQTLLIIFGAVAASAPWAPTWAMCFFSLGGRAGLFKEAFPLCLFYFF